MSVFVQCLIFALADGGGIRGLSALVCLEQLIDAANIHRQRYKLEPLEPWQMFDMIGGTSTGGYV